MNGRLRKGRTRPAAALAAMVVCGVLAGCEGVRESGAGITVFGGADGCKDPTVLLNQVGARDYWNAQAKAFRIAKRASRTQASTGRVRDIIGQWARYATGVSGGVAGQGGFTRGPDFSADTARWAIRQLDEETQGDVFGILARSEADAAQRLRRRSCSECGCGAETFDEWAEFWSSD